MRSMTDASKCDTCQVNDAYYYVAGVYTCAPCAIEAIKAKLPLSIGTGHFMTCQVVADLRTKD